jgi:hypothetical protein
MEKHKDFDFSVLYDPETQALYSKYDMARLYEDLEEELKELKAAHSRGESEFPNYERVKNSFFNIATPDVIDKAIADKEAERENKKKTYNPENDILETDPEQEYALWYDLNFIYDVDTKTVKPKEGGEFMTPKDKYLNENYVRIMENEALSEVYNTILTMQQELVAHTFQLNEFKGRIPMVNVNYKKDVGFEIPQIETRDEDGNLVRKIRMLNVADAINKRPYRIRRKTRFEDDEQYNKKIVKDINERFKTNFKSIAEVEAANKKINEENKELRDKAVSYDLKTVFPLFIESALNHKYKTLVEGHYKQVAVSLRATRILKLLH